MCVYIGTAVMLTVNCYTSLLAFECIVLYVVAIFSASAEFVGYTITVIIDYNTNAITTTTFHCKLDSGNFKACKLLHMQNLMIEVRLLLCSILGSDGFMFTSVSPGTHTVTAIGTSNGIMKSLLTLAALTMLPAIASENVQGATVTLTKSATFECRLDDEPNFVPCKNYIE